MYPVQPRSQSVRGAVPGCQRDLGVVDVFNWGVATVGVLAHAGGRRACPAPGLVDRGDSHCGCGGSTRLPAGRGPSYALVRPRAAVGLVSDNKVNQRNIITESRYPALYNPTPRHSNTLHCVNEVVFPLLTWPMTFDALLLVCTLVIRPILYSRVLPKDDTCKRSKVGMLEHSHLLHSASQS